MFFCMLTFKGLDVAAKSIKVDVPLVNNNIQTVSPLSVSRANSNFHYDGCIFLS